MRTSVSGHLCRTSIRLAVAIAFAFPALAEDARQSSPSSMTAISPIFSEIVSFQLPASFRTVFESTRDESYIREAVLAGETVQRWTQMITVTGFKDGATKPEISIRGFIESVVAGFKRACPTTFSGELIGETKIDGRDAVLVLAGCGTVGNGAEARSELALLVGIKGMRDLYSLQWAERGPPLASPPKFDPSVWPMRSKALHPIRVCAIVPGEKAPFPSCARQQ